MQRYLWFVVALAACAKSSKDGGPMATNSETRSEPPPPPVGGAQPPPQPESVGSPPPPPPGSGNATSGDSTALDHARAGASLGVSANTDAFDPLPEDGVASDRKKQLPAPRKLESPKGTAGKPTSVQATIGAVTVDGKPAPTALDQALKVRVSDVQACYDKAGKLGLEGALVVTFAVLPTGALANASVQSTTLKNMALESCVIGVVHGIKLAKPLGATETKATVAIEFAAK